MGNAKRVAISNSALIAFSAKIMLRSSFWSWEIFGFSATEGIVCWNPYSRILRTPYINVGKETWAQFTRQKFCSPDISPQEKPRQRL
jgi:hypothetical protein